jgi:hypothetical protein
VADGETGLIRVFDLANVWSALAIKPRILGHFAGAPALSFGSRCRQPNREAVP